MLVVGISIAGLGGIPHNRIRILLIAADKGSTARGSNHLIAVERKHAILGNLNVIFLFCREINGEKKNFCLVTNPRKKLKYSMFSEAES